MDTKIKYADIDYNYYHKVMKTLFPTYNYKSQQMEKPSPEFVMDIMQLFINYFDNFIYKLPQNLYNSETTTEDYEKDIESKSILVDWKVLSECNRLLNEFDFKSETPVKFFVTDLIKPSDLTVGKIICMLNICLCNNELDFTETVEEIQGLLVENASVQSSAVLMKKNVDLGVESECLQHKLDQVKTDEIERVKNAEYLKYKCKQKQREEKLDAVRSVILQRRNELKGCVDKNTSIQNKLVDENLLKNQKSQLEALKLKSENQVIEHENLLTKINGSKSSKELLEYHLHVMENSKELLQKQKKHIIMEDELKLKIKKNLSINDNLKIQIQNYKKEKNVSSDLDANFDSRNKTHQTVETEITEEEKKQDQLESDIDNISVQVGEVLIGLEERHTHWQNLATGIKGMEATVNQIMHNMLKQTLANCKKY